MRGISYEEDNVGKWTNCFGVLTIERGWFWKRREVWTRWFFADDTNWRGLLDGNIAKPREFVALQDARAEVIQRKRKQGGK